MVMFSNDKKFHAFGLFIWFYLTLELWCNERAGAVLGAERVLLLYGAGACSVALGFFLFGTLSGGEGNGSRRVTLLASAGAALSLAAAQLFTASALFVTVVLLATFCSGLLGARTLDALSQAHHDNPVLGRSVALFYGAAFLCQQTVTLVAPRLGGESLKLLLLLAAVPVIPWLAASRGGPSNGDPASPRGDGWPAPFFLGLLAVTGLLSALVGLNDGIITTLHAEGHFDVSGFTRLFAPPGLLLAGWCADVRGGRYLSLACAVAMAGMTLAGLLFDTPGTFWVAGASMYFLGAFMSVYTIVPFLATAPGTPTPALWAAAGRGVKYLVTGVTAIFGQFLFQRLSVTGFTAAYTLLLCALLIVIYFMDRISEGLSPREEERVNAPATREDLLKKYGISSREAEVLVLLLEGRTTAETAERLTISESTVKFHVANLLKKTGAKNRVELAGKLMGQNLP